jgi:hypothetical protein
MNTRRRTEDPKRENKNFLHALALSSVKENSRPRFSWHAGKRRQGKKSFGQLQETLGKKESGWQNENQVSGTQARFRSGKTKEREKQAA